MLVRAQTFHLVLFEDAAMMYVLFYLGSLQLDEELKEFHLMMGQQLDADFVDVI